MKKVLVLSVGSLLLLSSCGTYTGSGAYAGGTFGSIIGSAIGGISGGHRGSDIGTLIGMAGGAVVGAAIGQAADKAEQQKYEDYKAARQEARQRRTATSPSRQSQTMSQHDYNYGSYNNDNYQDNSGYDSSNSGDDRLYGFDEDFGNNSTSSYNKTASPANLEIRNARLVEYARDGVLTRGEEAKIVFEIYNNSTKPVYRVQPSVAEITGNKHIHISQNILVESIPAGKGVRYTANIKADSYLKNGEAIFQIGVFQNNHEISSQTREFSIRTSKR